MTGGERITAETEYLLQVLGATANDLRANREGRLGSEQKARWLRKIRQELIKSGIVQIIGVIGAVLTAIVALIVSQTGNNSQTDSLIQLLCIGLPLALIGAGGLVTGRRWWNRAGDIEQGLLAGRVQTAVVHINKQSIDIRRDRNNRAVEVQYRIRISLPDGAPSPEISLLVMPDFYNALEDGVTYLVYLLADTGRAALPNANIVGCERLDHRRKAQQIRQPLGAVAQPVESQLLTQRPNEVFISYSRVNEAAAQELVAALRESGLDCWFDLEDIPKTAEWWREIQKGITGANAVVFLASGASLRSEVCQWELNEAFRHSKKIIPILLENVFKDADLPPTLAALETRTPENEPVSPALQWERLRQINFIPAGTARAMADEVLAAARLNLAHVEQHTRFLRRALEWQAAAQNTDLLLRGAELNAAESWLNGCEGIDPPPDELHRHYLEASLKTERERLQAEIEREWLVTQNTDMVKRAQSEITRMQRDLIFNRGDSSGWLDGLIREQPIVLVGMLLLSLLACGALAALNTGRQRMATPLFPTRVDPLAAFANQPNPTLAAFFSGGGGTPEPTRTPVFPTAHTGEQQGQLRSGQQTWIYWGRAGEKLTVSVLASWRWEISMMNVRREIIAGSNRDEAVAVTLEESGLIYIEITSAASTDDSLYILNIESR